MTITPDSIAALAASLVVLGIVVAMIIVAWRTR